MRLMLGLLLGAVLGYVAGRAAPAREIAELREQLTRMEVQLELARKKAERRSLRALPAVGELLARSPEHEPEPASEPPPEDDGATQPPAEPSPGPQEVPRTREEAWEATAGMLATRLEMMRSALVERAGLDARGEAELDGVIQRFNDRLAEALQATVAGLEGRSFDELPPREALRLASELTDLFYQGQVELEEVVGAETLAELEPDQQGVWNLVDPDALAPLMDLP